MELKDFISETIVQIATGVIDAIEKCKGMDVIVNPDITVGSKGEKWMPLDKSLYKMKRRVQQVDMDICVTVSQTESSAMGAKVGISVFGFGANLSGTSDNKNESRIRFSIPVCLPVSK